MYSRVRSSGRGYGWPYQPSTTWGLLVPMPSSTRPWVRWSIVIAVMARVAGGRADSWETAVPRRTRVVREPHQASGVQASLP
jgi:chitodextrinase